MANMNDFNSSLIEEYRSNQGEVTGMFAGRPLLLLSTTGAKSGQTRVNPLMYLSDGDRWLVFASKGGAPTNPDWYHNVQANSEVTVTVRGQSAPARLVSIPDSKMETAERRIREFFAQKYGRATISYWYGNAARLPVILLVEDIN